MADLVTTLDVRDIDAQITLRQTVHDAAYRAERTNQAATERESDEAGDDKPRQTACGDPDGAVEHHRVDIVGNAGLDRQQVVALAIPVGVGELWQLRTASRSRGPVFQVTATGAGFGHDILNQQLALIVLEIPAIDIDVFRVGVHISN